MAYFETFQTIHRRLGPISVLVAAAAVSACVDTAVEVGARQAGVPQPRIVARPDVSPRGASVALTSIDGPPEPTTARFRQLLASASEARDIVTVAPEAAQYRVRGYLTASPGRNGTRVAYVWDVFDRNGRRAQRLSDEVAVAGGGDPWASLDDRALTDVAQRSAEDLAAFLSNTPEAIAAADGEGAGLSVVAAQRRKPAESQGARPAGVAEAR